MLSKVSGRISRSLVTAAVSRSGVAAALCPARPSAPSRSLSSSNIPDAEVLGAKDAPEAAAPTDFNMADFEKMLKEMEANGGAPGAGEGNDFNFHEAMKNAGLTTEEVQNMLDQDGLSNSEFTARPNDPSLHMPDENAVPPTRPDIASAAKTEEVVSDAQEHSFQTETKQMLDIVTNSLYTDKEVFLRELVSNASDALEKARYVQTQNSSEFLNPDLPFEVRLFPDDAARTLTIQDTGVGMNKDELISNLGTIARSGTKQFAQEMRERGDAAAGVIGQFGVGFYSAFMVGHKIEVFTKSARLNADGSEAPGYHWVSDGTGKFTIAEARGVERGTKIIIHLRPDQRTYTKPKTLENVLKKYSNYVSYPIFINGTRLNVVQAIWMMSKSEITDEMHDEFYRYHANAFDKPTYRMHFSTDAPIQINALFYFPERHMEKYGMGRMDPGTSLYSRKVLIKPKAAGLLPEYFRFVQGVVDSEDVPLNISRENMQDTLLISRISAVLTKRVIKFLQDESVRDAERYNAWYNEFNSFLKEGVCSDYAHKNELARLLRFESSFGKKGEYVSLDDYIARMPPTQTEIYYLCVPSRESAESSPYYESHRANGTEVLFLYLSIDEFVMKNLKTYSKRKLVSCEAVPQSLDTPETAAERAKKEAENEDLISYVRSVLGPKVASVTVSTRLVSSPAIVVDHESSSMRKMIKMLDQSLLENQTAQKLKLEINPNHAIFKKISAVRGANPLVARAVVEQVFDNALLAADILDNPRLMLPRMHAILEAALGAPAIEGAVAEGAKLEEASAAAKEAAAKKEAPKSQAETMEEFIKKAAAEAEAFEKAKAAEAEAKA